MSAVLRIAWREVRERRFLLAAAATLGLLAGILNVAPGPAWTRGFGEILMLVLFLAFPTSVALAVGSSLIGRDLAEGRLSFYFSRPLSSAALWAGKFLGGAVLVLGTLFCCLILFASSAEGGPAPEAVGFWIVLLLGLMAFAHVITAMYRSGSWLFALDLGLGALFLTVFGAQLRRLVSAGAGNLLLGELLGGVIGVAIAVATAGMLAAAAAQLSYGRADAHRGHVALSAAVWTFALAGLGGLALWSGWVLRVTPEDVGGVGYPLFAAPRGSALLFHGASWHGRAGFSPIFLMDGQGGPYVRLPLERVTPPAFAADGRTAVWVAPPWGAYLLPASHHLAVTRAAWQATSAAPNEYGGTDLALARLDGRPPGVEERRLDLPDAVSMALAVDDDGGRVLLAARSSVLLLDLPSCKLLASVPIADVVAAEFLAGGAVRFYQRETGAAGRRAIVMVDWHVQDGSRVERARVPGDVHLLLLARRGDLAVVSTGVHGKAILDAAAGAVRTFSYSTAESPGAALVLSNDNLVLSLGDEVRIVTRAGATVASLPLEPKTQVYALREPAPGVVAVGLWTLSLATRRTVFVDAATGALRREEKELLPAGRRYEWPLPPPEPGSLASRLFTDLDGALIALEADGRRRVIVAAP